ncbi:MAG: ATP synthase F1 subunit epsilon [bacterium]
MAKSFTVTIVTPEKTAFESEAVSVVLPGSEGYLGIWANHAPLVTGLVSGVVTIRTAESGVDSKELYMSVTGGFVEVSNNNVSILCDACEMAGEIDLERAKAALDRARKRMHAHEQEVDRERAREAIERAQARVHAAYLGDR